ncbi:MAG: ankyrin repeat domain-containing protein, partial [Sulfuritalea sp.]|nr:ankyrin repeat domain-containing protein [Sulfuritalea sp.]
MKFLNTLLAAFVLSFSINAMAVNDDDAIEFVEAITSGNLKIVKKYVESDAANVNYKSFAWSPIQMAANKNQLEMVK